MNAFGKFPNLLPYAGIHATQIPVVNLKSLYPRLSPQFSCIPSDSGREELAISALGYTNLKIRKNFWQTYPLKQTPRQTLCRR